MSLIQRDGKTHWAGTLAFTALWMVPEFFAFFYISEGATTLVATGLIVIPTLFYAALLIALWEGRM